MLTLTLGGCCESAFLMAKILRHDSSDLNTKWYYRETDFGICQISNIIFKYYKPKDPIGPILDFVMKKSQICFKNKLFFLHVSVSTYEKIQFQKQKQKQKTKTKKHFLPKHPSLL